MEGISVFDLVVLAILTYGLVFFLGVYAGRAAAWREGLQAILAPAQEAPPSPKKEREVPNHVHQENRKPPTLEEAHGANGAGKTRVVARRAREREEY